jgi:hypothetical protein
LVSGHSVVVTVPDPLTNPCGFKIAVGVPHCVSRTQSRPLCGLRPKAHAHLCIANAPARFSTTNSGVESSTGLLKVSIYIPKVSKTNCQSAKLWREREREIKARVNHQLNYPYPVERYKVSLSHLV